VGTKSARQVTLAGNWKSINPVLGYRIFGFRTRWCRERKAVCQIGVRVLLATFKASQPFVRANVWTKVVITFPIKSFYS